jgi:hypothetical protein
LEYLRLIKHQLDIQAFISINLFFHYFVHYYYKFLYHLFNFNWYIENIKGREKDYKQRHKSNEKKKIRKKSKNNPYTNLFLVKRYKKVNNE